MVSAFFRDFNLLGLLFGANKLKRARITNFYREARGHVWVGNTASLSSARRSRTNSGARANINTWKNLSKPILVCLSFGKDWSVTFNAVPRDVSSKYCGGLWNSPYFLNFSNNDNLSKQKKTLGAKFTKNPALSLSKFKKALSMHSCQVKAHKWFWIGQKRFENIVTLLWNSAKILQKNTSTF